MQQDTVAGELFDVFEASRQLGNLSPWTLRKHIGVGNVAAVRLGRRVFVRQDEIERIRRQGLPPLRPSGKAQKAPGARRHGRTGFLDLRCRSSVRPER